MQERRKVLWLVSWYPNKYDLFDGDFIQRHAQAASLHHDIHVLFIKQSTHQKGVEEIWSGADGLTEQIIYLPKANGLAGKFRNYMAWQAHYKTQVHLLVKKNHSLLFHVHIPWKAGLIALWARRKFDVTYFITEHWGIYNQIAPDNIHKKPFFVRYLLRRIFKQASEFASVSRYLGQGVNQTLIKKPFQIIPNVVDTTLFFPSKEKYDRFTFVHISNMVPLKNVEGILLAFNSFLQQTKGNAQLVCIGDRDDHYEVMAQGLNLLDGSVIFKGELSYNEVAKEMQRSHVFVLNSNIENSPCVIGEALCTGLPVIATRVGGIPELIDATNSLMVQPLNVDELQQAFIQMYQTYTRFRPIDIARAAQEKFSREKIASAFRELYNRSI